MYEHYSVLFVDDEVNILNSLRRGLDEASYMCYFASSGEEALRIMAHRKIDVIISDMKMPEMNGLDLLNVVSERWPKTVKIVLSGYTQFQQIVATVNQVDIFKFILKPYSIEEISIIIQKALEYYILQEDNAKYKKVLEAKNQAYQNMITQTTQTINKAKNATRFIGLLGNNILEYNNNFDFNHIEEIRNIFYMESKIFDYFSKAANSNLSKKTSNEFIQYFTKKISSEYTDAKIESILSDEDKIKINVSIVEAAIRSCLIVFAKEFKEYGLFLNMDANKEDKFFIQITLINNIIKEQSDNKNDINLDMKVKFLNDIFEGALEKYQVLIKAVNNDGNPLVFVIFNK